MDPTEGTEYNEEGTFEPLGDDIPVEEHDGYEEGEGRHGQEGEDVPTGQDARDGAEGSETEKSDSITGMSASELKKHKIEYIQLLKEIEGQNRTVEELKDALMKACECSCLTKCELKEIKKLRGCLEDENLKLQCMVQRAIQMQNENPSRNWEEVPIVTSIEDDVFPRMGNANVMASFGLAGQEPQEDRCDVCSKKSKKKNRPSETGDESLDSELCQLFEEMALKDKCIRNLNRNVMEMKRKLECQSSRKAAETKIYETPCKGEQNLEQSIEQMQCTVDRLKAELKGLCKEKDNLNKRKCKKNNATGYVGKSGELQKLREDFSLLMANYVKKCDQAKELERRAKGLCNSGCRSGNGENADDAELILLREKVSDLRDEQEEYTCIIKEQAEQLDDYRRKYLDAQQKVEEQKCMLEKIDMNNKRIEGQIEAEVKRIKAKFKEQLSELSQYPKLLENEQIKLATACKERQELENKLRVICKELKVAKESLATKSDKPDLSLELAKCENELILQTKQMEELVKEKEMVCAELLRAKADLDTMRTESAKIIISTKERFEVTKTSLNARIDTLEKELAQCRANAYLSITDREAVIKEMQGQLSNLSYSFDSAQKQIKTLKNHITFLSNDQCIPIKC